jgi:hypothetical protein
MGCICAQAAKEEAKESLGGITEGDGWRDM